MSTNSLSQLTEKVCHSKCVVSKGYKNKHCVYLCVYVSVCMRTHVCLGHVSIMTRHTKCTGWSRVLKKQKLKNLNMAPFKYYHMARLPHTKTCLSSLSIAFQLSLMRVSVKVQERVQVVYNYYVMAAMCALNILVYDILSHTSKFIRY